MKRVNIHQHDTVGVAGHKTTLESQLIKHNAAFDVCRASVSSDIASTKL